MAETPKKLHGLLDRQRRRHFTDPDAVSEELRGFLDAVNDAYWQSDADRGMLERSLDLSSRELLEANSEMRAMVQAQERSLSLLQATLESTADGILVVDHDRRMVAFNRKFAEMWRLPEEVLESRDDARAVAHVRDQLAEPDAFVTRVEEIYREPEAESHDLLELRDGRCFERFSMPQSIGGVSVGRVWSFSDVTARKQAEAQIRHSAYHDDLTDLPNRLLFKDRLQQALSQAQRTHRPLAALFLDLDRFKTINDTLGHAAGDRLLQEVARRLVKRQRASDTVARLGGDEFLVLAQNLRHPEDAAKVAEGMLEAVRPPIHLDAHELHVTASIGISLFPHDGGDEETLIKNADVAMYRAKARGRNTYRIYAPEMNARAFEFLMLENRLRGALKREEFVLHYQPQIDARSGRVTGIEALVRWRRDEGELVPPAEFISVAENTGQIMALGQWVLATACRQSREWQGLTAEPLRLAVNFSAHEFQRPDFLAAITETLAETAFDPYLLELELTESAIMQDSDQHVASLRQLREIGVRIAVDDFGTGHSSLAYLKNLPVNTLKIDRSFIRGCRNDPKDGALVVAIIRMAHSLELRVIAEGVENAAHMEFLCSQGCDEMQGYYFAPPMAPEDLLRFLAETMP